MKYVVSTILIGCSGICTGAETNSLEQLLRKADMTFQSWSYEQALDFYKQATNNALAWKRQDADKTLCRIGDCLYHLRRYSEAATIYETCLDCFPTASEGNYVTPKLGDCYVVLDQLKKARILYREFFDVYHYQVFDMEERISRVKKLASQPAPPN